MRVSSGAVETVLLWLFVIDLGIAFGAGLYEHRIVVARWIGSSVRLMRTADSLASVAAARRWSRLNYLRHALVLAAWLMSLRAFSLFYLTHKATLA